MYGEDAQDGPRAKHTAVATGQTLTAVLVTTAPDGKRIELWEVAGQDEQLLTYAYSPTTRLGIQIN